MSKPDQDKKAEAKRKEEEKKKISERLEKVRSGKF